jgi:hypothetical protein
VTRKIPKGHTMTVVAQMVRQRSSNSYKIAAECKGRDRVFDAIRNKD